MDVRRNQARIIDAAIDTLVVRPDASLQEIADQARVNRVTLYRHFPSREDLVAAIHESAYADWRMLNEGLRDTPGPFLQRLFAMTGQAIDLGNRYRIIADRMLTPEASDAEVAAALPFMQAVKRAQDTGEIDDRISVHYVAAVTGTAILAASLLVTRGLLTRDQAVEQAHLTLAKALAPAHQPSVD